MIVKPSSTKLLEKVENAYELVSIIARRARQLQSGDISMVKTDESSVITVASLEFEQDKFKLITDKNNNI